MSEDINYLEMDLLRFTTAGSVDDGKSTLIGRLFHDTKSIFEDQLEAIERTSKQRSCRRADERRPTFLRWSHLPNVLPRPPS